MDKEYIILNEIDNNSSITQRELSRKTKLSLGSVNILLNQMVHDGLIKLKQIPVNRALYMLTPKGMTEKAQKTRDYIKHHYNFIQQMKDKIELILNDVLKEKKEAFVIIDNDEIGQLMKLAVQNVRGCNITDINSYPKNKALIVANNETFQSINSLGLDVINILEKL